MGKTHWKKQWKHWVKPTRLPGIWKMQEGGFIARQRVTDPSTGRLRELKKVFPQGTEHDAYAWLQTEKQRVRAGLLLARPQKERFADYAVSLFERKVAKGELKSASSQTRWKSTLAHLIGGIDGANGELAVQGFGELVIEHRRTSHIEVWKEQLGPLITQGSFAPTTANGWLSILRVILKAATLEFELPRNVSDGVRDFDESEHVTYTEDEPNALTAEQVPEFLQHLKALYPQHYAMAYLGFATGLRPSSLRALRRKGEEPDFLPRDGKLRVRRSHTVGDQVMNTTKQKRRYSIELPTEVVDVLNWHVATQLTTPEQDRSDLLFPSIKGQFRAPTVLNKPFAHVSQEMGLGYEFTQRGMRRTFNDLARAAKVEALITKSISGHQTDRMVEHYSTVNASEQRASIAKVVGLFERRVA